jgi:hypothetical protein
MASDAQLLRDAATRLRDLATEATEGPWNYDPAYGFGSTAEVVAQNGGWIVVRGDHDEDSNLRWIAAMSPALAEPLAAWLEAQADVLARCHQLWSDPQSGVIEDVDALVEQRFSHPLAVARTLTTDPGETR